MPALAAYRSHPRTRVLAPALIAVLAVGTIGTGAVAAQDLRADQRHAAAVAKEKRDLARYRTALNPLAIQVFDAVQPVQDTFDDDAEPTAGEIHAQFDVIQNGGAVATLTTVKAALAKTPVPAAMLAASKQVALDVDRLIAACKLLDKASRSKTDKAGFINAFFGAYDALHAAETSWLTSLQAVYGEKVPLPVPSEGRVLDMRRKAATHGGFIARADVICWRMQLDVNAVPEHADSPEQARRNLTQLASIIRRGGAQLKTIPLPAADAAFLHRLRVQLVGAETLAAAYEGIVAATKKGDQAAYDRWNEKMGVSLRPMRDLSRSFDRYGAKVCGDVYNVDDVLAPKGSDQLRT